jgi:hypothetical protein
MPIVTDSELDRLNAQVAALRAELAALREQLATEVRTRRLVVIDENGFEMITAGRNLELGQLILRSPHYAYTWIALDVDYDAPDHLVGIQVMNTGTGVSMAAARCDDGSIHSDLSCGYETVAENWRDVPEHVLTLKP